MRVWMIDPRNYTPYYDYALCRQLGELGCDVRLLTSPFEYNTLPVWNDLNVDYFFQRPGVAGIPRLGQRVRLSLTVATYPLQLMRLLREVVDHRPEVFHVQWMPVPFIDILFLRALSRFTKKRTALIYTVHNVLPHEHRRWHGILYRSLYRTADQLIAHSNAAAEELVLRFGVAESSVHVLDQGNLADFVVPVPKPCARRTLGIPSSTPVLLFFGIIRPYKGLLHLLQAMPPVRTEFPSVRLLVVGRVHRNADMDVYRFCAEELGLGDAIEWHLRYVSHQDLGEFFGASDLVVLPYSQTTDSAVVPAAYTFGRPVVATAVGGLPEVVEEGRSGLLIPPGDVSSLAQAIIRLLSDDELRERMGRYASHLAETRHAWRRIAGMTHKVYQAALGSTRV